MAVHHQGHGNEVDIVLGRLVDAPSQVEGAGRHADDAFRSTHAGNCRQCFGIAAALDFAPVGAPQDKGLLVRQLHVFHLPQTVVGDGDMRCYQVDIGKQAARRQFRVIGAREQEGGEPRQQEGKHEHTEQSHGQP